MSDTLYIWLAEIGLTRPNGTAEMLYLCDGGLPPFSGDDPDRPNQVYAARLEGPPAYACGVSADLTRLTGDVAAGRLTLLNGDGAVSYLSGCPITRVAVKRGRVGLPWSAWTPVIDGRGGKATPTLSSKGAAAMAVPIYDLRGALSDYVDDRVYSGGNVGAVGVDGTVDDIKGQRLPLALGAPTGVPGVAVNTVSRAYQYDGGAAMGTAPALYDRGDAAALSLLATASSAAFDAATPSATQFIHDPARGLVRLGGAIGGGLTMDVAGRAAAGLTAATAARWLVGRRGMGVVGDSLTAWTAPDVGAWWPEAPRYDEALELMARSDGGWILPDGRGRWQFGRLGATAAPSALIGAFDVLDISLDDGDLAAPAWRVTVTGQVNHAPITSTDAMGAASRGTAREGWLRAATRSAAATDTAVKSLWGDEAGDFTIDTALSSIADMQALAERLLAAFGPRGDGEPKMSMSVTVKMTDVLLSLWPGQAVHLTYPREGIDADMLLLGVSILDRYRLKLRLWG
jgi:hypothetical protein